MALGSPSDPILRLSGAPAALKRCSGDDWFSGPGRETRRTQTRGLSWPKGKPMFLGLQSRVNTWNPRNKALHGWVSICGCQGDNKALDNLLDGFEGKLLTKPPPYNGGPGILRKTHDIVFFWAHRFLAWIKATRRMGSPCFDTWVSFF